MNQTKNKTTYKENQKRYQRKAKRNTDGFFNCKMVYVIELQRNGMGCLQRRKTDMN